MFQEKWFTTHIWHDYTSFDFDTAKKECEVLVQQHEEKMKSDESGRYGSDGYGPHINSIVCGTGELNVILNLIHQKIEEFAQDVDLGPREKLKIVDMWVNSKKTGEHHEKHSHPKCFFSGVIYISTNEKSGDIIFPNNNINPNYVFGSSKGYPAFKDVTYSPINGMIIIFPAWAQHKVMPNESDEVRISLAFNIKVVSSPINDVE